jgi:hypothetical protein
MRSFIVVAALACIVSLVAAVHAADEPDELMPGRVVIIKNAQVFKFISKPPTGMTFDLPDQTNAPTAEGGQLEVFDDDPFRPVSADFALPSSGWKGLGNPAGSKGYKYRGAGTLTDPCRVVLVKEKVVAVCKGSGVTLPTPFLGQVGIVLTVGTDSKRYCASFGGATTRHDDSVLRRKDAPPPDFCPLDLHSSTSTSSTSSTVSTTSSTISTTTSSTQTTTTSTISTTPTVCCESLPAVVCATGITEDQCTAFSGTVGAEGTVCDATGQCVPPPGIPGDCCDNFGFDRPVCSMPGFQDFCTGEVRPSAVCQAGVCGP